MPTTVMSTTVGGCELLVNALIEEAHSPSIIFKIITIPEVLFSQSVNCTIIVMSHKTLLNLNAF